MHQVYEYSKLRSVMHSIERPGFSVCEFNLTHLKKINEFILDKYIRHVGELRSVCQLQPVLDPNPAKTVKYAAGESVVLKKVQVVSAKCLMGETDVDVTQQKCLMG